MIISFEKIHTSIIPSSCQVF